MRTKVEMISILTKYHSAEHSRTRDYVHNFSDINAGAGIGLSGALIGYYVNYPSLGDKNCDLPVAASIPKEELGRLDV